MTQGEGQLAPGMLGWSQAAASSTKFRARRELMIFVMTRPSDVRHDAREPSGVEGHAGNWHDIRV